jgi:hypothetical protein
VQYNLRSKLLSSPVSVSGSKHKTQRSSKGEVSVSRACMYSVVWAEACPAPKRRNLDGTRSRPVDPYAIRPVLPTTRDGRAGVNTRTVNPNSRRTDPVNVFLQGLELLLHSQSLSPKSGENAWMRSLSGLPIERPSDRTAVEPRPDRKGLVYEVVSYNSQVNKTLKP